MLKYRTQNKVIRPNGLGLSILLLLFVSNSAGGEPADPHAHHRAMMQNPGKYVRSIEHYKIPDVVLLNATGDKVNINDAVNLDEPLMLNFIFTTCTAICPVLSATFAQTRTQLGPAHDDVNYLSISIDPEHDTPDRLKAYAENYRAGPEWEFFTGSLEDIISVQRAFNAYRGDKMNHRPLTFLRASRKTPWVRLEGFATASDLVDEYHKLFDRSLSSSTD